MISQQEFNLILRKCKELPPAKGMYLIHDFIENLLLTVLDFQMHNTAVKNAIAYYRDNHKVEIRNIDDLKNLLSKYPDDKEGNTIIAKYLWSNKYWNRVSLLRKLTVFFDSINITTQEDLTHWANISDFKRDFQGKIPGMGYAIYKWLIMRQGVETVKPDVHLQRFVESIIHHSLTDYEFVDVLEKVANQLGLKAYELDWRIWEHQKSASLKPEQASQVTWI